MENDTWDVVATHTSSGDSLWFGYHMAAKLRERNQSVRLFTDNIEALGSSLGTLDAALWMQSHDAVQIFDLRLAKTCAPARHLVQVFDARIPDLYIERFVVQRRPSSWFQLLPMDSRAPAGTPMTLLSSTSTLKKYAARLGDLPSRVGYVRSGGDMPAMRLRWADRKVRAGTLALLGQPAKLLEGKLTILAGLDADVRLAPWLRAFEDSPIPVCLFVMAGPQHRALCAELDIPYPPRRPCTRGGLTTVFLPSLPWHLHDELVWISDIVLTGRRDLAMQAAASGCPLLWARDDSSEESFLDWYMAWAPPALRATVAAACAALRSGNDAVPTAWARFRERSEEVRWWATQVCERVRKSPEASDVIRAALECGDDDGMDRLFANTEPNETLLSQA